MFAWTSFWFFFVEFGLCDGKDVGLVCCQKDTDGFLACAQSLYIEGGKGYVGMVGCGGRGCDGWGAGMGGGEEMVRVFLWPCW